MQHNFHMRVCRRMETEKGIPRHRGNSRITEGRSYGCPTRDYLGRARQTVMGRTSRTSQRYSYCCCVYKERLLYLLEGNRQNSVSHSREKESLRVDEISAPLV